MATLVTPNENRTEHSITVTCSVRPESDADMCVVMAMADGIMTRSGKYILKYIINVWIHLHSIVCVHSYVHTYICNMYIADILCIYTAEVFKLCVQLANLAHARNIHMHVLRNATGMSVCYALCVYKEQCK